MTAPAPAPLASVSHHWWEDLSPSHYTLIIQRYICRRCATTRASDSSAPDGYWTHSELHVAYAHPERSDVRVSRPLLSSELAEQIDAIVPLYRRELDPISVLFCHKCLTADREPLVRRARPTPSRSNFTPTPSPPLGAAKRPRVVRTLSDLSALSDPSMFED